MLFLCSWQKCDTSKHKILVVSVCPQSLPFFAIKFHLDVPAAALKLCGFFKSVGKSGRHFCPETLSLFVAAMPTLSALIQMEGLANIRHMPSIAERLYTWHNMSLMLTACLLCVFLFFVLRGSLCVRHYDSC